MRQVISLVSKTNTFIFLFHIKFDIIEKNPYYCNKKIWVIGDSFVNALKPYYNATFSEVHYLGHVDKRLEDLSIDLEEASEKPDIVMVLKVERSF